MTVRNETCSTAPGTMAPVIYVVDDMPALTNLYTAILEAAGYSVKAFNNREEALAALKADRTKPHLLITDYLGGPMPVGLFISHCRDIHPALRVLMASGLNQTDAWISHVQADRFIHKPFTLDDLKLEVSAALAAC